MPSIRCPYCQQQVDSERFDAHVADHAAMQADDLRKHNVRQPAEQRSMENLTGAPVIHMHKEYDDGDYEYLPQPKKVASNSNGSLTIGALLVAIGIVGFLVVKKIPAAAIKQAPQGNDGQQRLEQEKANQGLNARFIPQMKHGENAPEALLVVAGIAPSVDIEKRKNSQTSDGLQEAIQLENAKQYGLAVEKLDQLIEQNPDSPLLHNSKAWILATCSDDAVRDGKTAVEHATRACQLKMESPAYLDTLAAAYAEAGDFENALKTIDNAINLSKNKAQKLRFESRRSLYQDRKPFRK